MRAALSAGHAVVNQRSAFRSVSASLVAHPTGAGLLTRTASSVVISAASAKQLLDVIEDTLSLNAVNVTTALRRLAIYGPAQVDSGDPRYLRLERILQDYRPENLDARARAAVAWSAARLRRPQLLVAICRGDDAEVAGTTFAEKSSMVHAIAELGVGRDPHFSGFLRAVTHAAAAELETSRSPQLALDVLHSLQTLADNMRLTAGASQSHRLLSAINPASLTRFMVALAKADYAPPLRFTQLLQQEVTRQMPLFRIGTLTGFLWAHARSARNGCSLCDEKFVRVLSQKVTLSFAGGDEGAHATNASTLLWSFSKLRYRPDDACLAALDAALGQQASSLTPGRLMGLVHACGGLGFRPAAWPAVVDAIAALPEDFWNRGTGLGALAVGAARLHQQLGEHPADDKLWKLIDRGRILSRSDESIRLMNWASACAGRGPPVTERWYWLPCRGTQSADYRME